MNNRANNTTTGEFLEIRVFLDGTKLFFFHAAKDEALQKLRFIADLYTWLLDKEGMDVWRSA